MDLQLVTDAIILHGKSHKQVEALLEILRWAEGEPLSQDEIANKLDTSLGNERIN